MTTTNQGDETEASKVTVGSMVTMTRTPDFAGEVLEVLTDGHLKIRWTFSKTGNVSTDSHWEASDVGDGLMVIGAPEPVDWSRWLPPHPLPDTGKKAFKAGQVWAHHRGDGFGHPPAVFRVVTEHASIPVILAGRQTGELSIVFSEQDSGRFCILVQDVNEPHPRDPATLWGGRCNHGDCRQPLAQGNVELCAEHVASAMGRPAQQGEKAAPVTPQCQPSCRPGLRCSYCTTEVAGPTPTAPTKPKCPACDEERDLGATGKCWDCYEVGEAYVALVQQDADAKRAEIKRALMQPATLDPLWQRNPNVGVWRLR